MSLLSCMLIKRILASRPPFFLKGIKDGLAHDNTQIIINSTCLSSFIFLSKRSQHQRKALAERSPRHFKSDITCRTQPVQQPVTSFETQSQSQSSFGPDVSFLKDTGRNFRSNLAFKDLICLNMKILSCSNRDQPPNYHHGRKRG